MWYSAHAIFYFQTSSQSQYLVHENVYLIEADDADSAMKQALSLAQSREDTSLDGSLCLGDQPAEYKFAGIRKLVEVEQNPNPEGPGLWNGVEVSYSEIELGTLDEVKQLAQGKILHLRLLD